jgi:hypothetical protein
MPQNAEKHSSRSRKVLFKPYIIMRVLHTALIHKIIGRIQFFQISCKFGMPPNTIWIYDFSDYPIQNEHHARIWY